MKNKTDRIKNIKVTLYKTVESLAGDRYLVSIYKILNAIKNEKYKMAINAIRKIKDKRDRNKEKRKLPIVYYTGDLYKNNDKSLKKFTGIFVYDVDNLPIKEMRLLKNKVKDLNLVLFCFTSPSGNGLKIGILGNSTIANYQANYLRLMHFLEIYFNVAFDTTVYNINRGNYISSDKDIYINYQSEIVDFTKFRNKKQAKSKKRVNVTYNNNNDATTIISRLIANIDKKNIDITSDYFDWLNIAFALNKEFGRAGLDYFHKISSYYPSYNQEETENQFNVLNGKPTNKDIFTIVAIAKKYNVY